MNARHTPRTDNAALTHISPLIVLFPSDNVAVCRRNVAEGEMLSLDQGAVRARSAMQLGHKVARTFIPQGAAVIKYGMSIGSATVGIEPGEWVHIHNLRGDYVSTHSRSPGAEPQ